MSMLWDAFYEWVYTSKRMQRQTEEERLLKNFKRRCVATRKVLFEKVKKKKK